MIFLKQSGEKMAEVIARIRNLTDNAN